MGYDPPGLSIFFLSNEKYTERLVRLLHRKCMSTEVDSFEPIHQNVRTVLRPAHEPITPSTFLVPVAYYERMQERMEKIGITSVSIYLRILLTEYKMKVFQEGFPKSENVKMEYQKPGQGLVRVNFRPENSDWIVLSEISLGLGFSRCFVFVMMLELDLQSDENVGIQTPRSKRDGRIIPYAVAITQFIYHTQNKYQKKLRIYELSRLRDPMVQRNPHFYYKDGSLNYSALKSSPRED